MGDVNKWVAHFRRMAEGKLPPGTTQFIGRQKGGGATGPARTVYRVENTPIQQVTSAQQAVSQANMQLGRAPNAKVRQHPKTRRKRGKKTINRKKAKPKKSKAKSKAKTKAKSKAKSKPKKKKRNTHRYPAFT